eukprot:scaffold26364_cov79-Cyclotella_meneghiniana.AAC.2
MRLITHVIIAIEFCLATAWHISPLHKIHRWHLLVGYIHKSSSLFLSSEHNECSETETPNKTLVRKPEDGDILTFTLHRFEARNNEEIYPPFDTSGRLQLVLNGGHYLPSLHSLLSTMHEGETVTSATIDAGFGSYNPDLKITIPTSQIGDVDTSLVKIGTRLAFGETECRIVSMTDDEWVCDANHVLAGAEYEVDVTLESLEEGIKNWGFVEDNINRKYRVATFALGCFWGGELAYQRMPGVISTHVGYTQGNVTNPTYEEVCTGKTGHTEAIRVVYDPTVVTYHNLVQLGLDRLGDNIYKLNQVGNDRGTQYRHGIYYHNNEQKDIALKLLADQDISGGKEIMTEVKQVADFYVAEGYHQQYLMKGGQSAKKGAGETIRCYG